MWSFFLVQVEHSSRTHFENKRLFVKYLCCIQPIRCTVKLRKASMTYLVQTKELNIKVYKNVSVHFTVTYSQGTIYSYNIV